MRELKELYLTEPLYHSPFFFGRWSPSPMNRGGVLVTLNFHVGHYGSSDYLHSPSVHRGRGPPPQTTCGRVVRELDMKELKKGVVSKMFSLGMRLAQPWVKVGLTMG